MLHLLILFVLFTHSAIAMDVHLPNTLGQSNNQLVSNIVLSNNLENTQIECANAGAHCSHQQAHTMGLFTGVDLYSLYSQQKSLVTTTNSLTLFSQSPPVRPPKA